MLANRCCFRSQEIFLLIALGVSVDARALVETIIIVHSTIATRCLNEDLVDDLRMQLRGRRHDRREGVVDVVVGDDVVVQFVQYCRQITRRGLACKHHSSFTESHLRINSELEKYSSATPTADFPHVTTPSNSPINRKDFFSRCDLVFR